MLVNLGSGMKKIIALFLAVCILYSALTVAEGSNCKKARKKGCHDYLFFTRSKEKKKLVDQVLHSDIYQKTKVQLNKIK